MNSLPFDFMTYGNGLVELDAYNNRLQPSQLLTYNPNNNNAAVLNLSYGFTASDGSNNGNLVSLTSSATQVFMRSYTYDELNRLKTMSSPADPSGCDGLTWTYDAWANRTNQTTSSGACTESHPTIGANNQFTGAPYTYDAAGNMTADGNHTYTYDAENRLTTVDGGATATYVYDAEGQRVLKTTGGVTTAYLYDPLGNVVAETNGGDTLNIGYVYAGSQLVAQYKNSTTYFIHKDHLGSTRVMTAMDDSVYDSMDYMPYGEQIAGDTGTTHKFTGKERDSESGLDNFEARYDSSSLGRFMSADEIGPGQHPENPQSWNLYAYVQNNPLNLTDPTGQYVCDSKTVSKSQCDEFQKSLDTAQDAANKLKDKYGADSEKYKDAQRAIDAFGKEGVDNGVTIAQGKVGSDLASTDPSGSTVAKTKDNPNGQKITVTFDQKSHLLDASVDIGGLAALAAHEGSHVADASSWISSGFDPNHDPTTFQTEHRAYNVTASIADGLGNIRMSLQDFKTGKTTFNSLLPLGTAGQQNLDRYIKENYPNSNLKAWEQNTKGGH